MISVCIWNPYIPTMSQELKHTSKYKKRLSQKFRQLDKEKGTTSYYVEYMTAKGLTAHTDDILLW